MKILLTVDSETLYEHIESIILKDITPDDTLFIRDRKSDNRLRSIMVSCDIKIIQVRSEMESMSERNSKIFEFGIDKVIVFTRSDENNSEGLEEIQYLAYTLNIPLEVYHKNVLITNRYLITDLPLDIEKPEENYKINPEEYKLKLEKSVKMIKKIYYESLKTKSSMKEIDEDEVKKPSFAKSKNKKKKIKEQSIHKVNSDLSLCEERYD